MMGYTRTELAEAAERKAERDKRIAARRFTGEPITGFGTLRPEDSLVERICEIWNLDYTPEEIAIEAEERAQAEERQADMDRSEGFYERGLWEAYDAPRGRL